MELDFLARIAAVVTVRKGQPMVGLFTIAR